MSTRREERARLREEVIRALRTYSVRLTGKVRGLKLVVLFGSFARGDWREGSDADVLVVAEGLPSDPRERWDMLCAEVKGVLVEPHAYTPEEFEEMIEHGRMKALDPLLEEVVLYADPGYLEGVRRRLREAVRRLGLRRVEEGWARRDGNS